MSAAMAVTDVSASAQLSKSVLEKRMKYSEEGLAAAI
jgi:hypothetical protein